MHTFLYVYYSTKKCLIFLYWDTYGKIHKSQWTAWSIFTIQVTTAQFKKSNIFTNFLKNIFKSRKSQLFK